MLYPLSKTYFDTFPLLTPPPVSIQYPISLITPRTSSSTDQPATLEGIIVENPQSQWLIDRVQWWVKFSQKHRLHSIQCIIHLVAKATHNLQWNSLEPSEQYTPGHDTQFHVHPPPLQWWWGRGIQYTCRSQGWFSTQQLGQITDKQTQGQTPPTEQWWSH